MSSNIHVLRIALERAKPPIWRKVAVPGDTTLGELHVIIQIAMGWEDDHLHQFELHDPSLKVSRDEIMRMLRQGIGMDYNAATRGIQYFASSYDPMGGPIEMEGDDEDAHTIAQVCAKPKTKLIYEYDFGDGWRHKITVQKVHPPEPDVTYPLCLTGKGACPPEDCGGIPGYQRMLDILTRPDSGEREEILEWLGGDFDPEHFDIETVNRNLQSAWQAMRKPSKKRKEK